MLRVFPISLTGDASRWLRNEPTGSIKTWEDLKTKFLNKYCPPGLTAKKIEEINNFQQEPDETLYQAWERFKEVWFNELGEVGKGVVSKIGEFGGDLGSELFGDRGVEYGISTSIGYDVSSSLSNTTYSSKQINMAYPLPLDTAYQLSGIEAEILDFRAKFFTFLKDKSY
ncbi:reverse transcriptase domain-containing protein [Tanacetum coccineum]